MTETDKYVWVRMRLPKSLLPKGMKLCEDNDIYYMKNFCPKCNKLWPDRLFYKRKHKGEEGYKRFSLYCKSCYEIKESND